MGDFYVRPIPWNQATKLLGVIRQIWSGSCDAEVRFWMVIVGAQITNADIRLMSA